MIVLDFIASIGRMVMMRMMTMMMNIVDRQLHSFWNSFYFIIEFLCFLLLLLLLLLLLSLCHKVWHV